MKYSDLNPTEQNYNFHISVLATVFLEKLKIPFSTKSMFKVLSGAKGFGKSYLICLLALFFVANFSDYNAQLAKYTFKSARENYYSTMMKVINDLKINGVTIAEAIEDKEIRSFNSESRCEWVFPNGRVIRVIGFDNTNTWEGVPAIVGEWGMFAIDEVISMQDPIKDEYTYFYQLFNALVQIVRGKNLVTSFEKITELSWKGWQIYKQRLVIFGFNNHDTAHPIYQCFVNAIAPLTKEIKYELEKNAISWREDKSYMSVGAVVIRGSTKINEKNLNKDLQEFGQGLKKRYPEIYETLFMGGEHELNIDRYSYKKDLLHNAKFFDPKIFYWDDSKRYWLDEIRIGSDYADGGELGDDAVTILIGYEFDNQNYVKGIYILEELSISTRKYKDMTSKVNDIAAHLSEWADKYQSTSNRTFLKDNMKFRIGHDSRTIKDFIKQMLVDNYQFDKAKIEDNFSRFKATGAKGWSINSRHYVWKRLLAEGKIYFSHSLKVVENINGFNVVTKEHGYLYDELFRALNHPDKDIRDERPKKNKLDAINAAEHSLSFFRYSLYK